MKNNILTEVFISLVLIILSILLLETFHYWMPDMATKVVIALTLVVFASVSAFLFKEHARDERELSQRMIAGRASFLVGSSILIVGIITQSLTSTVDPWLVFALIGMVFSKILMRLYADKRL